MRVLIAEDEALLREGLTLLLSGSGMDVVGAAADAGELLELAARTGPDIVVTDIRMPPLRTDDGLRAALHLRALPDPPAVMVLSQFVQRRYAVELLADDPSGVGYLLKQRVSDVETFTDDVRRVARGGTVLDPEVVDIMLRRGAPVVEGLTGRQQQVLALIAQGRTNAAIAARLRVSERAVVQHTSNIYQHLGIEQGVDDHRRVLAVIRYLAD